MSESIANSEDPNSLSLSTHLIDHPALKPGPFHTFTIPYNCYQQNTDAKGLDLKATHEPDGSTPAIPGATTSQPFMTVLVGPSELVREGLSRILETAKFRILLSATCIHDLPKKPLPQHRPILLIIDVGGTDVDAELEKIADFKAIYPTSHVVVLADHCQSIDIVSAFRAGADGYLTKVDGYDTFIKALELVMLGQIVLPAENLKIIQDIRHGPKERELSILSKREQCILRCLIEGESNKTIAREINIAEATVKVHVKAILRKIRVRNRTQAAVWAMNHGALIPASGGGN